MFSLIGTRHLPIALGSNLLFYFVYLWTKTNCWVDFAWAFNQSLITNYLFFTQPISVSTIIPMALINLWGLRLGSFSSF